MKNEKIQPNYSMYYNPDDVYDFMILKNWPE